MHLLETYYFFYFYAVWESSIVGKEFIQIVGKEFLFQVKDLFKSSENKTSKYFFLRMEQNFAENVTKLICW